MSKRNFILLIIILAIVVLSILGFFYLTRNSNNATDSNIPGINFLSQFNPFKSNPPTTGDETPGIDINGDGFINEEELAKVKLKKVSSVPVAGFTVFSKERFKEVPLPPLPISTEGETVTEIEPVSSKLPKNKPAPPATEFAPALRYVERATGNIYQTFVDKIEERKFSETIIPKIYDAYFGNNGQSVVMRHLKSDDRTIETFYSNLPKEKLGEDLSSNDLKGSFLVDNIKDISLSPDTTKIFYLNETVGSITGTILNLANGNKTQIFNSAFTEWNSFWPSSKIVTLTTKPSGEVGGHLYVVDVDKKNLTRMLGDVNGLTTEMSPNGKLVLVGNNNLSLYVYHTDTKAYDLLGIKTLPEKCVWSKNSDVVLYCAVPTSAPTALYPDSWYRGEVSFSDQIWKINLSSGSTNIVADPILVPGGEDIDAIKLTLDQNEKYLFFVNKVDSFLWELELE